MLNSRVAIVTGGARGIGRACVEAILNAGARGVVIADNDADAGESAAREIDASGEKVIFSQTDVTVRADHERTAATAVERFGQVDILVNNAGIAGSQGSLTTHSDADLDRIIDIIL